ncbi:uncharacterized protein LOC111870862 [Cryptotermes secundus]|uniref:uncharacterized protein LOC111870862 n=1 Tax=Cryptotermes secundus TaxID=105785 RepID=UPI000CD7B54D|nr:uncharacterized protein LOC111870862 [Cryptotermes secundus]
MVSLLLCVASLCTLLQTVSPSGWNSDLQVQESRNYLSDARVKNIQDLLLLHDNYEQNQPHNPQRNLENLENRPQQHKRTPAYRPEYPTSDLSKYRQHQTQGYEIYEETDLPSTIVQQNSFREHSSGKTQLLDPAVSEGSVNYQKMKSTVHQSLHRKPTGGLSVTEGLSSYPYMIVRPQGDVGNHKRRLAVPGVMLAYQTTPTTFQGSSGVLPPNSHASLGQYVHKMQFLTCTDARGHQIRVNPSTALLLASSLNQIPIIPTQ